MSSKALEDLGQAILDRSGGRAQRFDVACEELTVHTTVEHVVELLRLLRDDATFRFNQLTALCGVDYPERPLRFDVVYQLISYARNVRLRV